MVTMWCHIRPMARYHIGNQKQVNNSYRFGDIIVTFSLEVTECEALGGSSKWLLIFYLLPAPRRFARRLMHTTACLSSPNNTSCGGYGCVTLSYPGRAVEQVIEKAAIIETTLAFLHLSLWTHTPTHTSRDRERLVRHAPTKTHLSFTVQEAC